MRASSENGENSEVGRQGDGHSFQECTQNHLHRLLGERKNDYWILLRFVIAPVERGTQEKATSSERDKNLFYQDSAKVQLHLCSFADKIMELNFQQFKLLFILRLPDLAQKDFLLFPDLQKLLGGNRFTSNQINAYFENLSESYFLHGIKYLDSRFEKCIELKEDYVEQ